MGCTTAPPMSSRLLKTLLVLAYPPSTASRPHPSRSLPTKSAESATTWSTPIASWNLRLGCSDSASRAKPNWISYLATSLAFLPVSNTTRFASLAGKRKHTSRNKLLNVLPNIPLRQESGVTTWVLVLCAPPHLISLVPTRKPTTLSPRTMDSHHIS
jgi:hypothetical protein